MTQISLVVSDVDGTLLTKDKTLTDRAKSAVQRLHKAGIGFTITSSRPAIGMRFLIEPLALWLPVGPFNGSSIIDPEMNPVEQHLIPAGRGRALLANPPGIRRRYLGLHHDQMADRQSRTANTSPTNSTRSGPIRPP